MAIFALALLLFFNLVGFVAIFFTNFGTFIILLGAVFFAFMTNFQVFDVMTLLLFCGLYVAGEILEYVLIIIGAKKWGASNAAIVGALGGGIIGAILGASGFAFGIILGTFLGVFLGAFAIEMITQRDFVKSLKAGAGSVVGRLGAIIAKVLIALIIFGVMTVKSTSHFSV